MAGHLMQAKAPGEAGDLVEVVSVQGRWTRSVGGASLSSSSTTRTRSVRRSEPVKPSRRRSRPSGTGFRTRPRSNRSWRRDRHVEVAAAESEIGAIADLDPPWMRLRCDEAQVGMGYRRSGGHGDPVVKIGFGSQVRLDRRYEKGGLEPPCALAESAVLQSSQR